MRQKLSSYYFNNSYINILASDSCPHFIDEETEAVRFINGPENLASPRCVNMHLERSLMVSSWLLGNEKENGMGTNPNSEVLVEEKGICVLGMSAPREAMDALRSKAVTLKTACIRFSRTPGWRGQAKIPAQAPNSRR